MKNESVDANIMMKMWWNIEYFLRFILENVQNSKKIEHKWYQISKSTSEMAPKCIEKRTKIAKNRHKNEMKVFYVEHVMKYQEFPVVLSLNSISKIIPEVLIFFPIIT